MSWVLDYERICGSLEDREGLGRIKMRECQGTCKKPKLGSKCYDCYLIYKEKYNDRLNMNKNITKLKPPYDECRKCRNLFERLVVGNPYICELCHLRVQARTCQRREALERE